MIILHFLIFVFFACLWEFTATFTHKYIMHGFLWVWHEDHHKPHKGWFEKNDLFVIVFSGMAIAFFTLGYKLTNAYFYSAGLGITLYGIGYFLFHDVMFHRRIKGFRIPPKTKYLRRIIRAHAVHHQKSNQKQGGVSFGFLYAPRDYRV